MSFPRVFALAMLFGAGLARAETPESIVLGDAKAGAGKAAACGACHGIDGNSADATYPKLAGQNESYIARQLGNFKAGKRVNPIMAPFAATLSEQDMHDIGAYFATQQATPGQTDEAYVERAQKLYRAGDSDLGIPACMACHGPSGRGMAGAAYPQLVRPVGRLCGSQVRRMAQWHDLGRRRPRQDHARHRQAPQRCRYRRTGLLRPGPAHGQERRGGVTSAVVQPMLTTLSDRAEVAHPSAAEHLNHVEDPFRPDPWPRICRRRIGPGTRPGQWQEGKNYFLIEPAQATTTGDKIEVVEVFSYACPHCNEVSPMVAEMKKNLPANAEFVYLPVQFGFEAWKTYARAFYTAQALGILEKSHADVFRAIYVDKKLDSRSPTFASIADFYSKYGVSAEDFIATSRSFAIEAKLKRNDALVKAYGVDGTPEFIVNGKYRITGAFGRRLRQDRTAGPLPDRQGSQAAAEAARATHARFAV